MAPIFRYTQQDLLEALKEIENSMSISPASIVHNVPYTTLFK